MFEIARHCSVLIETRWNQSPPAGYEPFFAGWSLAASEQSATFGISHPGGEPKNTYNDVNCP